MSELAELERRREELTLELQTLERQAETRAMELRKSLAEQLAEFQRLEREVAEAEAALDSAKVDLSLLQTEAVELRRFEKSAQEHLKSLLDAGVKSNEPLIYDSTLRLIGVVALMGGVILILLYVMIAPLLR